VYHHDGGVFEQGQMPSGPKVQLACWQVYTVSPYTVMCPSLLIMPQTETHHRFSLLAGFMEPGETIEAGTMLHLFTSPFATPRSND
jgi:hypothetical protein